MQGRAWHADIFRACHPRAKNRKNENENRSRHSFQTVEECARLCVPAPWGWSANQFIASPNSANI